MQMIVWLPLDKYELFWFVVFCWFVFWSGLVSTPTPEINKYCDFVFESAKMNENLLRENANTHADTCEKDK